MRPIIAMLFTYIGFTAASLEVLVFKDKYEVLGVLIAVTIALIIVGMVHARHKKPQKGIPRKLKNRVVRNRSKDKSRAKVVKS